MKKTRIALEIFTPALLGTALLLVVKREELAAISFSPRVLVTYLGVAYAFSIIPSIAYAFIMEAWLKRRPKHKAGLLITVGLSTLLGLLAGALVRLASEAPVVLIGGAVGLILGLFLSFLSSGVNGPNQPPQRNAGSRPFLDDSPASESSPSLGPRG